MYKNLAFFFVLLVSQYGFSQHISDAVYLNNGSIIKGEIMEYFVNEYVTIKSTQGINYTYKASEIKSVTVDTPKDIQPILSGYFNNTSFGVLIGESGYANSLVNFTFNTINGYQFNSHLQAGLGLGMDVIYGEIILPVFFDFRYYFRKSSFSPFAACFFGNSFQAKEAEKSDYYDYYYNSNQNLKTGHMYGVELGIRNYTKENVGYTLSVGYRFQYLSTTYKDWNYNINVLEEHYLNRFKLTMGVIFN